ncbi:MAG: methyltransferase domain-containing protein [Nannocystaceae bacterium]|nr:methyltransferase domain-containing protein [Nannocystaceae bacterium]
MPKKSLGERSYEQFAARYAKYAQHKPHNAMYERPATLSLLPDVAGLRVLDAGCGPGIYTQALLERGAEVVAFDVTPAMIALARQRVRDRATLHVADLSEPLAFAADAAFDLVICPLALDYIEHWHPVFSEFFRVLRPGGTLVYSHGHPMSDYNLVRDKHDAEADYFACEQFTSAWGGFGTPRPVVEAYRRPLAQMLNPLARAGFVLDTLLEPLPTASMRETNPQLHATLTTQPCFVCVRAGKPSATALQPGRASGRS